MNDIFSKINDEIFNNAAVILVLVNEEGRVVKINRATSNFTGQDEADIVNHLGGELFRCVHAFCNDKVVCGTGKACSKCSVRNAVLETLETGNSIHKRKGFLNIYANGKPKHIDLLISTTLIENDSKKYVLLTLDDVSEAIQNEDLIHQLSTYKEAANNANIGIWKYYPKKGFFEWGKVTFSIFEVPKEKFKGKIPIEFWHKLVHAEDKVKALEHLNYSISNKGTYETNHRIVSYKTQKTKHIKAISSLKFNENEELEYVFGLIMDVSKEVTLVEQLKVALQKIKEKQVQLIQAEKMASLGVLTSGAAHQINNPLNYISGSSSSLRKYLKNNKEVNKQDIEKYLGWIDTGVDRISAIVRSLNKYSSDDKERNEVCNIHEIIDQCLLFFKTSFQERIAIVKNYTDTNLTFTGNYSELLHVLTNIISNAVHAIKSKGTITITTTKKEQDVVICIEDTGCGIEKENIERVTDPFYSTRPAGRGVGLGMYVSNTIVLNHNGSLTIESEVDKGTKVFVALPFCEG